MCSSDLLSTILSTIFAEWHRHPAVFSASTTDGAAPMIANERSRHGASGHFIIELGLMRKELSFHFYDIDGHFVNFTEDFAGQHFALLAV